MNEATKLKIQGCKDMIKGRTAEAIVEELFKILGFSVHRYGIESSLPSILSELSHFRNNSIIDKVRSLPDFIITNGAQAYEIEVKYRESNEYNFEELIEKYPEYPHVNVLFVLVSPKGLKCISYAELKAGCSIKTDGNNFLGNRPEFSTYKDTIEYYSGFVKNIFNEGLKNAPVASAP